MSTFVDTNVLVYLRDQRDPAKQEQAGRWLRRLWADGTGRLSTQVLGEYYVTVTRKLEPPMAPSDAAADVEDLMHWRPQPVDADLVRRALRVQGDHGLSYWDSLIVAAAQTLEVDHLLTEDLHDEGRYGGVTVLNPFRHDVAEVLGGG